jgi:hypothetical protein
MHIYTENYVALPYKFMHYTFLMQQTSECSLTVGSPWTARLCRAQPIPLFPVVTLGPHMDVAYFDGPNSPGR